MDCHEQTTTDLTGRRRRLQESLWKSLPRAGAKRHSIAPTVALLDELIELMAAELMAGEDFRQQVVVLVKPRKPEPYGFTERNRDLM